MFKRIFPSLLTTARTKCLLSRADEFCLTTATLLTGCIVFITISGVSFLTTQTYTSMQMSRFKQVSTFYAFTIIIHIVIISSSVVKSDA